MKERWINKVHCLGFSISNLTEFLSLLIILSKGNKITSTFIHTKLIPSEADYFTKVSYPL